MLWPDEPQPPEPDRETRFLSYALGHVKIAIDWLDRIGADKGTLPQERERLTLLLGTRPTMPDALPPQDGPMPMRVTRRVRTRGKARKGA